MTTDEALGYAIRLSERHDDLETRLVQLEVFAQTTGLKAAEHEENMRLWREHDVLEREVIAAFAVLYILDPEVCERLRNGEEV